MKAWAIRCNQCDYECAEWIGRAKMPHFGLTSFPVLGVFSFVPESERLAWKSKEIADLLCQAILIDRWATEGRVWPEDQNKFVVEEIDWPDHLGLGRFSGI